LPKMKFGIGVAVLAIGIALLGVLGAGSRTALANEPIDLHTATAKVDNTACPDTTNAYWHFVLAPNNQFHFTSIHLNIGGTLYDFNTIPDPPNVLLNGTQDDNLFVLVPAGKSLGDLSVEGSYATYSGTGTPNQFNLSHVCTGTTEPPSGSVNVMKTATPGSCDWSIDKKGDSAVFVPEGGSATINYTIDVDADCTKASGTITVTNSGTTTVTITSVTDTNADVDVSSCSPALSAVLAPGESVVCDWEATSLNSSAYDNTATADWTDADSSTHSDDSEPVNVAAVTDLCATAGDTGVTGSTPSLPKDYCAPGDVPASITATKTVTAADCPSYKNEAIVTGKDSGTEVKDSATTSVGCLGRTAGYWGNRNGQGRISSTFTYTLGTVGGCVITVTKSGSAVIEANPPNGLSLAAGACTPLDAGLSSGAVNNLLAQTLALKLNATYVSGFSTNTVGSLGCTSYLTAYLQGLGLSSTSTINQVLAQANILIGNVKTGGVVVASSQVGDFNALLGQCMNRES
jgi:hypothetical protein